MSGPALADPGSGQDGSPAGLPSPLDSVADISNQPTSKGIVVRLERTSARSGAATP